MNGLELLGRAMRIGRPTGTGEPMVHIAALDVSPLMERGLISRMGMVANPAVDKKQRMLYVGNIVVGLFSSSVINVFV